MVEGSIFKQHPVAVSFYVAYLLGWLWIVYLFLKYGDDELPGFVLLAFSAVFMAPFLIVITILTAVSKTASKFYFRLALLILAPIPLAFILSMLKHTTLGAD
ncbi:hypothetical protein [Mucilaginibacter myungsuensis]